MMIATSQKPLSQRLRDGTRKVHRSVEDLAFLRSFLRGVVSLDSYGRYLVDLEHVYAELERGLCAYPTHPAVGPLILPALFRQRSLWADIAFFSRQAPLPRAPSKAARRYGDRLREIAETQPALLIAHAYTRYLGDLSGGRILGRITARALALSGSAGLSFYAYPGIANLSNFKHTYRALLDSLPIDEDLAERIVSEAIAAFHLNGAIIDELSGSAFVSLWRLIFPAAAVAIENS